MRRRSLASVAALALVLAVVAACSLFRSETCGSCGRAECKNMGFAIRLQDGSTVKTCCPRCGLHYIREKHPAVTAIEVRDFDTAKTLDARTALYVEGSDLHPCSMSLDGGPKDERGCCLAPVYDRCRPSVIAFADAPHAQAFARKHGGVLTTFASLEDRVK